MVVVQNLKKKKKGEIKKKILLSLSNFHRREHLGCFRKLLGTTGWLTEEPTLCVCEVLEGLQGGICRSCGDFREICVIMHYLLQ